MLCKSPINNQFGCGQCIPCRLKKRGIWQHRIMLEANLHSSSSFLTLTYARENVPTMPDGKFSLDFDHLKNFWKRFRLNIPPIRHFSVGEYGHDGTGFIDSSGSQWNPHYHAALFGFACLGKIQRPETGPICYCDNCQYLSSKWGHGNITLDELSHTSAGYICGYTVKKMTSPDDVRLEGRPPEATRMSQGIARGMVFDIQKALQSDFGPRMMSYDDVPTFLMHGKKRRPLGRYLRTKIRQSIDLHQIDPHTGEIKYTAPPHMKEVYDAIESPQLHSLQKTAQSIPIGSPLRSKVINDIDSARATRASVRKQKILNLEARYNINKSKGDKKL